MGNKIYIMRTDGETLRPFPSKIKINLSGIDTSQPRPDRPSLSPYFLLINVGSFKQTFMKNNNVRSSQQCASKPYDIRTL